MSEVFIPAQQRNENIPSELKHIDRWVRWKWEKHKDSKNGSYNFKKPPLNISGKKIDCTNPENHSTFEDIKHYDRIGFVFNKCGYTGMDFDNCRDPETGKLSKFTQDFIDTFTDLVASKKQKMRHENAPGS
jgi:primase-polymerase (primpol)-like protein